MVKLQHFKNFLGKTILWKSVFNLVGLRIILSIVCVCMCVCHVCADGLQRPEEDVGFPRAGAGVLGCLTCAGNC